MTEPMKTEAQIRQRIKQLHKDFDYALTGRVATVQINAPRALLQSVIEAELRSLHWTLDEHFKSKLTVPR